MIDGSQSSFPGASHRLGFIDRAGHRVHDGSKGRFLPSILSGNGTDSEQIGPA